MRPLGKDSLVFKMFLKSFSLSSSQVLSVLLLIAYCCCFTFSLLSLFVHKSIFLPCCHYCSIAGVTVNLDLPPTAFKLAISL